MAPGCTTQRLQMGTKMHLSHRLCSQRGHSCPPVSLHRSADIPVGINSRPPRNRADCGNSPRRPHRPRRPSSTPTASVPVGASPCPSLPPPVPRNRPDCGNGAPTFLSAWVAPIASSRQTRISALLCHSGFPRSRAQLDRTTVAAGFQPASVGRIFASSPMAQSGWCRQDASLAACEQLRLLQSRAGSEGGSGEPANETTASLCNYAQPPERRHSCRLCLTGNLGRPT